MATKAMRTGMVKANGVELYHDVRGDGPPVVFVVGGGCDAQQYQSVAELLDDEYTVVTYDRRGLSRSPRPPVFTATSIEEQADDCAALIEALGLGRAVVFGNSLGGTIAVSMLERHERLMAGAIVHEPGLSAVSPSAAELANEMMRVVTTGMAAGGPEKALEAFARWIAGDAAWEAVPVEVLPRGVRNFTEVVPLEVTAEAAFRPDEAALAAVRVPVHAVYGRESAAKLPRALIEGAQWVAETTGGPLHEFPGMHNPFLDRPAEFVAALRPILASMTQGAP